MADELEGRAAVPGSEPVGRADRDGGAAPDEFGVEGLPPELRERLGDEPRMGLVRDRLCDRTRVNCPPWIGTPAPTQRLTLG